MPKILKHNVIALLEDGIIVNINYSPFAGDFNDPWGRPGPHFQNHWSNYKKKRLYIPWRAPSSHAHTIFVLYKDSKELTPAASELKPRLVFSVSVQGNHSTRTGANLTRCQSNSHHGGGPLKRHGCQELWTCRRFVGVRKPAGTGGDSKWQELRLTGRTHSLETRI